METKHKRILIGIIAVCAIYFCATKIITENEAQLNDEIGISKSIEKVEETRKSHTNPLVYITGAVEEPGVYEMPGQQRVNEVITNAGGLLPYADTSAINLAEVVQGGEHIHVPFNFNGNPEALLRKKKININTATEEELMKLKGVGQAIAKRIVEYRSQKGNFTSIEGLKEVKGIGEALFKKNADAITV